MDPIPIDFRAQLQRLSLLGEGIARIQRSISGALRDLNTTPLPTAGTEWFEGGHPVEGPRGTFDWTSVS